MEWKEVVLGELVDIYDSKRIPLTSQKREKIKGDIPYYGAQGIIDYINQFLFDGEYILIAEDGNNIKSRQENIAQIAKGKFWVNNHAHILQGKIEQNLLCYIINHTDISGYVTGSAQPKLNQANLLKIPIKIPVNLSDQRKIAGILSALDAKIENNNKINANLEAQAEALFKSWFVDFTPFKDQPFVDSELGPIPQGWKVGKLGDYCEVKSGYAFKSSWWTNKGYKIIKIKNISENGDINLNDCSCVLPENCDKAKNFIANTGDIVIAMTGATIGKFNIIPKIDEKFYINQRVGKFFLGEKPIEKVPYIYCFLKQENISTQIIQKGQGSAQPNISGADIESIPMLTPMSIILKYNKMCQPLFEKILSNRLESKKLSALRDTLLPKLMSGEIKL